METKEEGDQRSAVSPRKKVIVKHYVTVEEMLVWLGHSAPPNEEEVVAFLARKTEVQSSQYSSFVSGMWQRFQGRETHGAECFVATACWLAGSRAKQWMQMGVAMLGAAWGSGSILAGFRLAEEVRRGVAVERSAHRAREILTRLVAKEARSDADRRGLVLGRHLLGLMLLKGEGGVVDVREGTRQLESASGGGSCEASLLLARLYHGKLDVVGAPYSIHAAATLYSKAIDQGDKRSGKSALGLLHIGGEISGADGVLGMRLLREASQQGDAAALRAVGTGTGGRRAQGLAAGTEDAR